MRTHGCAHTRTRASNGARGARVGTHARTCTQILLGKKRTPAHTRTATPTQNLHLNAGRGDRPVDILGDGRRTPRCRGNADRDALTDTRAIHSRTDAPETKQGPPSTHAARAPLVSRTIRDTSRRHARSSPFIIMGCSLRYTLGSCLHAHTHARARMHTYECARTNKHVARFRTRTRTRRHAL
jgi:hypothetical protein